MKSSANSSAIGTETWKLKGVQLSSEFAKRRSNGREAGIIFCFSHPIRAHYPFESRFHSGIRCEFLWLETPLVNSLTKDFVQVKTGLFIHHSLHISSLACHFWSSFSWAMKMATTNANEETTRARNAGWNRPFKLAIDWLINILILNISSLDIEQFHFIADCGWQSYRKLFSLY